MPEGLFPTPDFVRTVINLEPDLRNNAYIRRAVAPLFPETDFLGMGADCITIVHPYDQGKVVSYEKGVQNDDPFSAWELYYVHNFLWALFPHNFPKVYGKTSGLDSKRVAERIVDGGGEVIFPFSKVIETCEEMCFPLSIDGNSGNFIVGSDGGEYYVDKVDVGVNDLEMANFLRSRQTKDGWDQKTILYFTRLRELMAIKNLWGFVSNPEITPIKYQKNPGLWYEKLIDQCGFDREGEDLESRERIMRITSRLEEIREGVVPEKKEVGLFKKWILVVGDVANTVKNHLRSFRRSGE
ncbi:MAG: hypothetical protein WCV93_00935 [Candidatus Shapirobacteria bacterium]|jgi:hypothetical protein